MRCNAGAADDGGGGSNSEGRITNDPEIQALNMKIEKRKMELERSNRMMAAQDGFTTDCDTVTTGEFKGSPFLQFIQGASIRMMSEFKFGRGMNCLFKMFFYLMKKICC